MEIAVCIILYIVVGIVVGKLLYMYESANPGKYRVVTTVDPTNSIFLGMLWPLSLPMGLLLLIGYMIVAAIKHLFYKGA